MSRESELFESLNNYLFDLPNSCFDINYPTEQYRLDWVDVETRCLIKNKIPIFTNYYIPDISLGKRIFVSVPISTDEVFILRIQFDHYLMDCNNDIGTILTIASKRDVNLSCCINGPQLLRNDLGKYYPPGSLTKGTRNN